MEVEGRLVGPYRLLRRIGDHSGMATVYLAEQPSLGRKVALKELDLRSPDPRLAERFIAEARIGSALRHPNIVRVDDFLEHEGVPYIAMEYAERGSLRAYVGTTSTVQVLNLLEQVLAGLAHAHDAGIIHRDLKPENLLLAGNGVVKIADFGIAKALGRVSERFTDTGVTVGTPAYMAPEQATGKDIGPATDLYALGVVTYELLSGSVPFANADTPLAMLFRKVNEPCPPLTEVDPRLAMWVANLLEGAPERRPASARAAAKALEEIAVALYGAFWRRGAALGEPPSEERAPPTTPEVAEAGEEGAGAGGCRDGCGQAARGGAAAPVVAAAGRGADRACRRGGGSSQAPARRSRRPLGRGDPHAHGDAEPHGHGDRRGGLGGDAQGRAYRGWSR